MYKEEITVPNLSFREQYLKSHLKKSHFICIASIFYVAWVKWLSVSISQTYLEQQNGQHSSFKPRGSWRRKQLRPFQSVQGPEDYQMPLNLEGQQPISLLVCKLTKTFSSQCLLQLISHFAVTCYQARKNTGPLANSHLRRNKKHIDSGITQGKKQLLYRDCWV